MERHTQGRELFQHIQHGKPPCFDYRVEFLTGQPFQLRNLIVFFVHLAQMGEVLDKSGTFSLSYHSTVEMGYLLVS